MRSRRVAGVAVVFTVVAAVALVVANAPWATTTVLESGASASAAPHPSPAGTPELATAAAEASPEGSPTTEPEATPQPGSGEIRATPTSCYAGIQFEPGGQGRPTPEALLAAYQSDARAEAERIARDPAHAAAIERGRADALSAGADRLRLVSNTGDIAEFEYEQDGRLLATATALRAADGWHMSSAHAAAGPEVCAGPSPPPAASASPGG